MNTLKLWQHSKDVEVSFYYFDYLNINLCIFLYLPILLRVLLSPWSSGSTCDCWAKVPRFIGFYHQEFLSNSHEGWIYARVMEIDSALLDGTSKHNWPNVGALCFVCIYEYAEASGLSRSRQLKWPNVDYLVDYTSSVCISVQVSLTRSCLMKRRFVWNLAANQCSILYFFFWMCDIYLTS